MRDDVVVSGSSLVRASITSEASEGGEEEEVDCSGRDEGSAAAIRMNTQLSVFKL